MKSKVNLAVMAVSLCLACASQADQSQELSQSEAMREAVNVILEETDGENVEQQMQSLNIQPCYRWPHPCD